MSSPTLFNLQISDTFSGILHSNAESLPSSGKSQMYDGSGNASALTLGRIGNGATVSGQLSASSLKVGQLSYVTAPVANGAIVVQTSASTLGLVTTLPGTILDSLVTADTYTKIKSLQVTSQGLIKGITTFSNLIDEGTYNNIKSITVNDNGMIKSIKQFDVDSDDTLVTATRYFASPLFLGTVVFNNNNSTIGSTWKTISLPNKFSGAKSGIFYFFCTETTNINNSQSQFTIWGSNKDKGQAIPLGGTTASDNNDDGRPSFQCACPISSNSNNLYVASTLNGSGTAREFTYHVYAIAAQY